MSLNPPDVPKVPDYTTVANQQTTENRNVGAANQAGSMPNQTNQFGSVTHQQVGVDPTTGVPLYQTNTNLSPTQQGLFDTLMGTKGVAGTQGQNLLKSAGYGDKSAADVIGGMTSGTTQDILGKETSYLDPYFKTERDQLDTKLRNQGLNPGNPGYDVAMRGLDTTHSGTVQDFLAKAEPAAYAQAKSTYEEPLNIAGALAGFGSPSDPTSNLVNTPGLNMQTTNYIGAADSANKANMSAYQAQQQKYSSMLSGLMGIPAAAAGGWAKAGFPGLSAGLGSLGVAGGGAMEGLAALGPAALALL